MTRKEFQRFEKFIKPIQGIEVKKFRGWFHVYDEKAHLFGTTIDIKCDNITDVIIGNNIAGVPFNYIRSINFYIQRKYYDYEIHF